MRGEPNSLLLSLPDAVLSHYSEARSEDSSFSLDEGIQQAQQEQL